MFGLQGLMFMFHGLLGFGVVESNLPGAPSPTAALPCRGPLRFGVWVWGWGLGFWVEAVVCRVQGSWLMVQDLGFRVQHLGFRL